MTGGAAGTLGVDLEGLPDLPAGAAPWLVAALLLAWLALRVALLRGQTARAQAAGDPAPRAPRWLATLAAQRFTLPVLLALIGACAAFLVSVF